jgi:hypothetical protein
VAPITAKRRTRVEQPAGRCTPGSTPSMRT